MNKFAVSVLFVGFMLGLVGCNRGAGAASSTDGSLAEDKLLLEGRKMEQEARVSALTDGLYAHIQTNKGDILVRLFEDKTPLTVMNFVGLAEGKFPKASKQGAYYDGLKFHRVIQNFMIQGGDPQGNGTGGPGYRFSDEIVEGLVFDRPGLLAMANAGPGTNGSQFFITHVPTRHLDGKHTIFGEVVAAEDQVVVDSIAQGDVINHVYIIRKGTELENYEASQEKFDDLVAAPMQEMQALAKAKLPNAQVSEKGVFYVIEREGSGDLPRQGSAVKVHYEGRFLANDQVFDSSYSRNEPITVAAGVGQVIEGWDEMLMQMRVGEKRVVIIPSNLAYGEMGYPGVIPPNSWMRFSMERME